MSRRPHSERLARAIICIYKNYVIVWDEKKRAANLRKHRMDLADAALFEFDTALVEEDLDAIGEQRFRAIGWIADRLCFLAFAEAGDDTRLISLRATTTRERRRYHEQED